MRTSRASKAASMACSSVDGESGCVRRLTPPLILHLMLSARLCLCKPHQLPHSFKCHHCDETGHQRCSPYRRRCASVRSGWAYTEPVGGRAGAAPESEEQVQCDLEQPHHSGQESRHRSRTVARQSTRCGCQSPLCHRHRPGQTAASSQGRHPPKRQHDLSLDYRTIPHSPCTPSTAPIAETAGRLYAQRLVVKPAVLIITIVPPFEAAYGGRQRYRALANPLNFDTAD